MTTSYMKKREPLEKTYELTYWASKGANQRIYDAIEAALVPGSGEASSKAGEMVRLVGNVYYERFNNGGGFYSGQREAQARELKKLCRFATPKLNDERAWDAMVDAVLKQAWAALLDEPAALKLVLAELAKATEKGGSK